MRKFVFNCYVTLKSEFPWKPDQALLWTKKESGGFRWCVVVLFLAPLSSDESNGYRHPSENFLIAVMKSNLIRANMLVIVSWCESRKFNQSEASNCRRNQTELYYQFHSNQPTCRHRLKVPCCQKVLRANTSRRLPGIFGPPPVRWENERIKFEDIWLLICKFSLKV